MEGASRTEPGSDADGDVLLDPDPAAVFTPIQIGIACVVLPLGATMLMRQAELLVEPWWGVLLLACAYLTSTPATTAVMLSRNASARGRSVLAPFGFAFAISLLVGLVQLRFGLIAALGADCLMVAYAVPEVLAVRALLREGKHGEMGIVGFGGALVVGGGMAVCNTLVLAIVWFFVATLWLGEPMS